MRLNSRFPIAAAAALLMSTVFISGSAAQTRVESLDNRTSLKGTWKINLEDNKAFSGTGYDDSSWDSVNLPGSFVRYILQNRPNPFGVLWIRKTIHIDRKLANRDIGLILGRIACADETYFNGHLVGKRGSFPPNGFSMWNHPRDYQVPAKIVHAGEDNVIAIRIYYFAIGEMIGNIAITGSSDLSRDSLTQNFARITTGYIIIAMGTPFVIIFLFFFIRRRNGEYFYYCLQLFFGFFIVLDLCTYWDLYGSMLMRLKVLGFAWVGLNVAHPIFLHRIYGLQRKKIEKFLWIYFAIILFTGIVFTNNSTLQIHGLLLILATTSVGFYNASCHISALIKKKPYARLFSFFGLTVIIGAIHDGLVHFSKFTGIDLGFSGMPFQDMIFHYTAAFLFTGTSLVLVHQFINVMNTVEDLNINLEKKVLTRTEELLAAKSEVEATMEEMTTINENLTVANRELEKSDKRHERDMILAGNVQSAFFSSEAPRSDTYDIAFMSRPLTCVSGDFYDFYYTGDTLSGVGLFDVSGHGISSGLITLLAKSIIHRVYTANPDRRISEVMETANSELIDEINTVNSYVTGILLRLNHGHVEYVNSGHPELLYKSAKSGRAQKITDRDGKSIVGPFLGVKLMEKPFKSVSFKINRNDCLLLYSDCLVETKNSAGKEFDETKLTECFEEASGDESAKTVLDHIKTSFFGFIGDKSLLKDDLSIIVIKKLS